VSQAADETQISRETHYTWLREDPEYKKAVMQIQEHLKDVGEGALLALLIEKNPQVVLHFAKTKLKERGYGEEAQVNQQMNYTFKIVRPEEKPSDVKSS
jgi:hypothetical protein